MDSEDASHLLKLKPTANGVGVVGNGVLHTTIESQHEPAPTSQPHPAESPESQSAPSGRQLSLWRVILFGLAGPPLQMTGNITAFFFSIFLLEVARLSPAYVSIICFSGRFWDAVTDPVIGQLLSLTRTRLGKTRPWILCSSVLGSVMFFCMWWPLAGLETQGGKFAYYLIMHLVYCTLITCYHIPYTSSTVLLSEHPADRDAATAARIVCDLLFTIVGSAVFGAVIGSKRIATACGNFSLEGNSTEAQNVRTFAEQSSYQLAAGLISAIFFTCGIIGFFGIREKVASPVGNQENVLRNLKKVIAFKPYVALMMAFLFMSLGIQTIQANLGLFTTHRLKIGWHMTFGFMSILLVAALLVPIVHFLNSKIGKKKNFILGVLIGFPCVLLTMMMEPYGLALYYVVTCLSGVTISVAMLQPWSMLPDVIEAFYRKTGERKEATFYSLYAFFTKFAAGISLAASQLALWLGNYNSNSCEQPESVAVTLRWLMGPGPTICLLISLVIMVLGFPEPNELLAIGAEDMSRILQSGETLEIPLTTVQSTNELNGDTSKLVLMEGRSHNESGNYDNWDPSQKPAIQAPRLQKNHVSNGHGPVHA